MAAFSSMALLGLGLAGGAIAGGLAAKKLGGNQTTQQPQTLAPPPVSPTLAQPTPPAPLPMTEMAKAAGEKQRKRSGGGVNLAQPLAPRASTMPTAGAGKGRTLLGY